jgi:UDP-GlcNAc:undecaprenyl-phosphate GlcNAc-1-phosphate transferase
MFYVLPFIISFVLAVLLTLVVKTIAYRLKILDYPREERKIHQKPIPLLGGWAIFLSFFLVLGYYVFFTNQLLDIHISGKHLLGIFLASLLLIVGGSLDDKFNLKPKWQIIWPILAALIIILSGIGIGEVTNPFGGKIDLALYDKILFWWQGLPYKITLPTDIITFVWLLGMMYTTKFLDGLDGLATGISAIAVFLIFLLSTVTVYLLPEVALVAIVFVGACLGFLIFNFYPAKIFLGEGGSLFIGFIIGVLAILAGSKIATTLLVMGIAILDVLWVILRRIFWEKKAPFSADKKHLHFRLLDIGFSQRQAVLFLYFLAAVFGLTALFLQSKEKLIVLGILALVMVILGVILVKKIGYKNKII